MKIENRILLVAEDKANVDHVRLAYGLIAGESLTEEERLPFAKVLQKDFTFDDARSVYQTTMRRCSELRQLHKLDGSLGLLKHPELDADLAEVVHRYCVIAINLMSQFMTDLSDDLAAFNERLDFQSEVEPGAKLH